jgi:hypothetical protein
MPRNILTVENICSNPRSAVGTYELTSAAVAAAVAAAAAAAADAGEEVTTREHWARLQRALGQQQPASGR